MIFFFYAYRSLLARIRVNAITMISVGILAAGGSLGFAFYAGLQRVLVDSVSPVNILVIPEGASAEGEGELPLDTARKISVMEGIRVEGTTPLVARELLSSVQLTAPVVGEFRDAVRIRGIDEMSLTVHGATVTSGAAPAPKTLEMILGRKLAAEYPHLRVGSEVHLPGGACRIVGIFAASGGPFENEAWTNRSALELHLKTTTSSSMTIVARDRAQVRDLVGRIKRSKDLQARAMTVAEFRAKDAGLQTIARIVLVLLLLLSFVATIAIATTMNAAVAARIPELAALAAIGIRRTVLGWVVLLESATLGVIGAALGAIASAAIGARLTGRIPLAPTSEVVGIGLALGVFVGVIGGVMPAIRVRKLDILRAMR